jgi:hypothetical protein
MGKRKQTHSYEDQYGEHKSQDRQEQFGFSKGDPAAAADSSIARILQPCIMQLNTLVHQLIAARLSQASAYTETDFQQQQLQRTNQAAPARVA